MLVMPLTPITTKLSIFSLERWAATSRLNESVFLSIFHNIFLLLFPLQQKKTCQKSTPIFSSSCPLPPPPPHHLQHHTWQYGDVSITYRISTPSNVLRVSSFFFPVPSSIYHQRPLHIILLALLFSSKFPPSIHPSTFISTSSQKKIQISFFSQQFCCSTDWWKFHSRHTQSCNFFIQACLSASHLILLYFSGEIQAAIIHMSKLYHTISPFLTRFLLNLLGSR